MTKLDKTGEKRYHYKIQFLSRNEHLRKFYEEVNKICPNPQSVEDIKKAANSNREIEAFLKRSHEFYPLTLYDLFHIMQSYYAGKEVFYSKLLPSISLLFLDKEKGESIKYYDHDFYMDTYPDYSAHAVRRRQFQKKRGYKETQICLAIDTMDKDDKTITIKIHLDRKKEDVIKDVKLLLSLLEKEAKSLGIDLKRPKPHLSIYDQFLRVYDLRQEKKSWSVIASQVFPKDVGSPIRKVRHYYAQAKKMVNGGWKQI